MFIQNAMPHREYLILALSISSFHAISTSCDPENDYWRVRIVVFDHQISASVE